MARRLEGMCVVGGEGGGCTALWCGMLCAGLELITIGEEKKFTSRFCHPLVFERLSGQMHVSSVS